MRKARAPKPDGQTDAPPAEPTTEPKAASKDRVFADAVRQVYGMTRRRLPDIEVKAAIDAAWASLDATAQAAYLVAAGSKNAAVLAEAKRQYFSTVGRADQLVRLREAAVPGQPDSQLKLAGTGDALDGAEDEAAGPA